MSETIKKYGEYEQVNGAVVNRLMAENDVLEKRLRKADERAWNECLDAVIELMGRMYCDAEIIDKELRIYVPDRLEGK